MYLATDLNQMLPIFFNIEGMSGLGVVNGVLCRDMKMKEATRPELLVGRPPEEEIT